MSGRVFVKHGPMLSHVYCMGGGRLLSATYYPESRRLVPHESGPLRCSEADAESMLLARGFEPGPLALWLDPAHNAAHWQDAV